MAGAEGQTKVEETIFENRFRYTAQLAKLGADIEILQRTAIIKGVKQLLGTRVEAEDLRGGAALVLAGLSASGETIVENIEFIERGYSGFHKELEQLGADIKRDL